jgi:hypothetical protein
MAARHRLYEGEAVLHMGVEIAAFARLLRGSLAKVSPPDSQDVREGQDAYVQSGRFLSWLSS